MKSASVRLSSQLRREPGRVRLGGIALAFLLLAAAGGPRLCPGQKITNAGQRVWGVPVESSSTLQVGGAVITVDFGRGALDLPQADVLDWIARAASAVSTYYGRFPVRRALVLVVPRAGGRGILQGTTWGDVEGAPAFTRMVLGEHTTREDLNSDWTMTHEMVHTAFPDLAEEHHWLEEGIATYVEPIARVEGGQLDAAQVWAEVVRNMPQGEPEADDRGLDRTHTWARTYWGGALFCLEADVEIRRKTGNRKGLRDALRAIMAAGGTIDQSWPIERALRVGDQATGTTVLLDLYRRAARAPYRTDLEELWGELGIRRRNSIISFDNHEPMASLREGIMSPGGVAPVPR